MKIINKKKIFIVENRKEYFYEDLDGYIKKIKTVLEERRYAKRRDLVLIFTYSSWLSFAAFYLAAKELDITVEATQNILLGEASIKVEYEDQIIIYLEKRYPFFEKGFDQGFIIGTSGSTGNPKKIYLSYSRLTQSCYSIKSYMNTKSDDFHAWGMPPDYVYGLSMLNQLIESQSSSYIINTNYPIETTIKDLGKYCINKLYGVPSGIRMLVKYSFHNFPKRINTIFIAGGKCDQRLADMIVQLKKRLCIMYGCTEASARLTYLYDDIEAISNGCVGKPIEGVEIKIMMDSDKKEVVNKENKQGEVVFKSKFSSLGYYENNLIRVIQPNEWVHTGDIGYIEKDRLYITGRKARFAKVGGIKISLGEVESFIHNIYPESEVCCVRKDNMTDTDTLYCFLACEIEDKELKDQFIEYCNKNKIRPKWITAIKFKSCKTIPKTSNGKTNYKLIEGGLNE